VENHHFNSPYKIIALNLKASWQDVKRCMNERHKEPKRPCGRPRKHQTARKV
jgi:hypothetical protein